MHEEIATRTDRRRRRGRRHAVTAAERPPVTADSRQEPVLEALKNVYDPELGINIVDLGLVYDVQMDEHGGVDIQYSLTTMGCPIGPLIEDQMRGVPRGRRPASTRCGPSSCCARRGARR